MIFVIELVIQNAIVILAEFREKPLNEIGIITGTADMSFWMHFTAWVFGLFTLVIRLGSDRIPLDFFWFMEYIDIEHL